MRDMDLSEVLRILENKNFLGVVPQGLWDLSSLTRDQTHAPRLLWKCDVLTTGLPGNSLENKC